jgi:hypothetical protein
MIFYKWEQSAIGEIDMAVIDFKNAVMSRFKLVEGLETYNRLRNNYGKAAVEGWTRRLENRLGWEFAIAAHPLQVSSDTLRPGGRPATGAVGPGGPAP